MKKSDIIQRVNTLLVTLGQSTDTIISKIFTSKCAHFYGAQAWNFKDKAFEDFQRAWNPCVRRLLKLPYQTHSRYIPSLVGTSSAKHQIYTRFVKLVSKMENSGNARDKAAIMQIKELKDVLNGQCDIIGFTLEAVENMMCDICVD